MVIFEARDPHCNARAIHLLFNFGGVIMVAELALTRYGVSQRKGCLLGCPDPEHAKSLGGSIAYRLPH